jgi:hypothetical protein
MGQLTSLRPKKNNFFSIFSACEYFKKRNVTNIPVVTLEKHTVQYRNSNLQYFVTLLYSFFLHARVDPGPEFS